MKLTIACIGKLKNGPEKEIEASYFKRLPFKIEIKELEEKKNLPADKLKNAEAKLLLAATENTKRIVLDEKGTVLSSEDFARKLKDFSALGKVSFLIGGAAGHGEEVKKSADLFLSLGRMTWPHMLVRPMLAEQIYRAHTIITGHPYHKV